MCMHTAEPHPDIMKLNHELPITAVKDFQGKLLTFLEMDFYQNIRHSSCLLTSLLPDMHFHGQLTECAIYLIYLKTSAATKP